MGQDIKSSEIVLLFDYYSTDSKDLHHSFLQAGWNGPAIVIEEDGFLPDGVISVFGAFLGDFANAKNIPGRPRYFNQIKVPEYWEISGTNKGGSVHDLNKERARIFYAEPKHKRLVRIVDWYDERGIVRSSDHYNRYGALYARTIFNAKGQKVSKTYFSATGQEIIMEHFVTGDIVLNDGKEVHIFRSKTDFVVYFLEKHGYSKRRLFFNSLSTPFFVSQRLSGEQTQDVLFWQEPIRDDIPGNMKIILEGRASRTSQIMVQKKLAYDKLLELGAPSNMVKRLGFVYPFEKENEGRLEALICTNSDRIEHCKKLVEELPQVHFYIAALTEMSSKLLDMGRYKNVTLYPGVKKNVLDDLFVKCDYYFDVNHESEIVSAVRTAFLQNHLIFAFRETLHNSDCVAPEHIYVAADVDKMIADVKTIIASEELLGEHLKLQRDAALTEAVEAYMEW